MPSKTAEAPMKKLIYCLLFTTVLFAKDPQTKDLNEYLELMRCHSSTVGFTGNFKNCEIELVNDLEKISDALKKTGRDVGILYQDKYWIWVNDPILCPNGKIGVYGRILNKCSLTNGLAGCAVVPVFKDGKIALNCNFRHATRTWELEIPRGMNGETETAEEAAKREVLEETGFVTKDLTFLGEMPPDTGQTNAIVAVYMASIADSSEATPEDSEAIESILAFSVKELREGLKKSGEKEKKVFLRDPFLTFALIQMDIRGLLNFSQNNEHQ
jgi:ADP-ribose pyrophosphatase